LIMITGKLKTYYHEGIYPQQQLNKTTHDTRNTYLSTCYKSWHHHSNNDNMAL